MINIEIKKKFAESWFSYLQNQICKEFEFLEKGKKKFIKRDWNKKNKLLMQRIKLILLFALMLQKLFQL